MSEYLGLPANDYADEVRAVISDAIEAHLVERLLHQLDELERQAADMRTAVRTMLYRRSGDPYAAQQASSTIWPAP